MITIANALTPVLALILVGFAIRRGNFLPAEFWPGAEKLTYFLLMPATLIHSLAGKEIGSLPWAEMLMTVEGAVLASALLVLLWRVADRRMEGPAFTSLFQGGVRFNTFVALALAENLFGIVLDTSPMNQSVFNYRLNIGYGYHSLEQEDGFDFDSNGIYIENIFGFALVRNENFRWWAGPLVRTGYYEGDSNTQEVGPSVTLKNDIEYAEFGMGAVTGMNFKSGGLIISPSLGFRVSAFAGDNEWKRRDSSGSWSESEDFEATTTSVFANIALLF